MKESNLNIKKAVPFFFVTDMTASLHFYMDGLGFEMKNKWTPRGTVEWCWLQRDNVAIMLQEYRQFPGTNNESRKNKGEGVSICFICENALDLYREFVDKGLRPAEPFVGNNMWDVEIVDPDGYRLHFESMTEVPEETRYSDWTSNRN